MNKLEEKLEQQLKDLGYNYYGNFARKYYKGFELKIEFSEDLSISKTSVDIELYGPMYDEIEKEQTEAREIIKNDVEVLKEFIIKNKKTKSILEDKPLELGYEEINILTNHYVKRFCIGILIHIIFDKNNKYSGYVKELPLYMFETQQDIDNLQQAFNQLQKDLEVLNL